MTTECVTDWKFGDVAEEERRWGLVRYVVTYNSFDRAYGICILAEFEDGSKNDGWIGDVLIIDEDAKRVARADD